MSTHSRISQEEKVNRGLGHKCNNDVQNKIPASKLRMGSVENKVLVPLTDGKTWICVHRKKEDRIHQIKNRYEKHQSSLR